MEKKKIPPKLMDIHCKNCVECEKRRLLMKNIYSIEIPSAHVDEIVARDMLLDQTYERCCKCFMKTFEL
jgi:hypothetical protein